MEHIETVREEKKRKNGKNQPSTILKELNPNQETKLNEHKEPNKLEQKIKRSRREDHIQTWQPARVSKK